MSYVYIRSEPGLFTVGHYSPDGKWHSDSDYASKEAAVDRVMRLNGHMPTWYCGCGHTNGANLPTCACCGRDPNGQHRGQPSL